MHAGILPPIQCPCRISRMSRRSVTALQRLRARCLPGWGRGGAAHGGGGARSVHRLPQLRRQRRLVIAVQGVLEAAVRQRRLQLLGASDEQPPEEHLPAPPARAPAQRPMMVASPYFKQRASLALAAAPACLP